MTTTQTHSNCPVVLFMLWGNWGFGYQYQYLTRLRNNIKRFSTKGLEFVCLTDRPEYWANYIDITFIGIPDEVLQWPLNLPKFYMHKTLPQLVGRWVFFFDLDTTIVGNVDEVFEYDGYFAAIQPFNPKNKNKWLAGGILSFVNGSTEWMYNQVAKDPKGWAKESQGGKERLILIQFEQQSNVKFDRWQDILPQNYIISYKKTIQKGQRYPRDTRVICFHGNPRPHQLNNAQKMKFWK